jgi:hypothetical protein
MNRFRRTLPAGLTSGVHRANGVVKTMILTQGIRETIMSIVLYVGGSKDGTRGLMPYGFTRSMLETETGREIYVEHMVKVEGGSMVRVMALESMHRKSLLERVSCHYASLGLDGAGFD